MNPSAVTAAGLVLDVGGALILAFGLMFKHPRAALDEATPRWNFNSNLDVALARQTADAQVGASLLASGFAVQLVSALGWHRESDWLAVSFGLAASSLFVVAASLFLIYWRRRRVRVTLFYRLQALELGTWPAALSIYGALMEKPQAAAELPAAYGARLLGRRWAKLTRGLTLPPIFTQPWETIPGGGAPSSAPPPKTV